MIPLVLAGIILVFGKLASLARRDPTDRREVWIYAYSWFLLLTYVVFTGVSTTVLRFFNCIEYMSRDVDCSAEIDQCVRPAWRYYLLFWPPRRSARVLGVLARGVLGLLTRTFDFRTGGRRERQVQGAAGGSQHLVRESGVREMEGLCVDHGFDLSRGHSVLVSTRAAVVAQGHQPRRRRAAPQPYVEVSACVKIKQ